MFNNTEEFGQYLQNIIDRHREDLSILLRRHGIDAAPTPALLVMLYQRYGDEFIEMLAELPDLENYEGLLHAEGQTTLDKIKSMIQKGVSLIGNSGIGGALRTNTSTAQPPPPPPKKDTTKKIVIIGVVVIVVLTIILIAIKKKKS